MSASEKPILYKVVLVGNSGVGKTNLLASFAQRKHLIEPGADQQATSSLEEHSTYSKGFSNSHPPTISVEFVSTTLRHPTDGSLIKLQIWDTVGQERYRAITPSHYRRAAGALLVYDVTSPKSLDGALNSWLPELDDWPLRECVMLVGNKMDLLSPEDDEAEGGGDGEGGHGREENHVGNETGGDDTAKSTEKNPPPKSIQSCKVVSKQLHKESFSKANVAGSIRTSAKTGENVVEAFQRLVFHIHEQAQAQARQGIRNPDTDARLYDHKVSLSYLQAHHGEGREKTPNDPCAGCST